MSVDGRTISVPNITVERAGKSIRIETGYRVLF